MEYRFRFLTGQSAVIITTSGEADADVVLKILEAKYSHSLWVPGMSALIDHRQVDMTIITSNDLKRYQSGAEALVQKFGFNAIGKARDATVVSRPVDYGIVRQWEIPVEADLPFQHKAFMSYADALEWLGITDEVE